MNRLVRFLDVLSLHFKPVSSFPIQVYCGIVLGEGRCGVTQPAFTDCFRVLQFEQTNSHDIDQTLRDSCIVKIFQYDTYDFAVGFHRDYAKITYEQSLSIEEALTHWYPEIRKSAKALTEQV